jgi:hypothetical protein
MFHDRVWIAPQTTYVESPVVGNVPGRLVAHHTPTCLCDLSIDTHTLGILVCVVCAVAKPNASEKAFFVPGAYLCVSYRLPSSQPPRPRCAYAKDGLARLYIKKREHASRAGAEHASRPSIINHQPSSSCCCDFCCCCCCRCNHHHLVVVTFAAAADALSR